MRARVSLGMMKGSVNTGGRLKEAPNAGGVAAEGNLPLIDFMGALKENLTSICQLTSPPFRPDQSAAVQEERSRRRGAGGEERAAEEEG